jgi:hypothetical protein
VVKKKEFEKLLFDLENGVPVLVDRITPLLVCLIRDYLERHGND